MNEPNKDYFTFNVHDSALLVGQTGSGKTELVRQYIRCLEKVFTPEQVKYVIYDLKMSEFNPKWESGAREEYLYTSVRTGKPEDMDYLEELADLAEKRAAREKNDQMIFIYIEECDMAVQYPGRFHDVVMKINNNANSANMKLIFSTSRPSPEVIPVNFRNSFDLILSGPLSSKFNEEIMGIDGGTALDRFEFFIKEI